MLPSHNTTTDLCCLTLHGHQVVSHLSSTSSREIPLTSSAKSTLTVPLILSPLRLVTYLLIRSAGAPIQ